MTTEYNTAAANGTQPSTVPHRSCREISGSAEELALLGLELLVGQRAALEHALELLELGATSTVRRGGRRGRRIGPRSAPSGSG